MTVPAFVKVLEAKTRHLSAREMGVFMRLVEKGGRYDGPIPKRAKAVFADAAAREAAGALLVAMGYQQISVH